MSFLSNVGLSIATRLRAWNYKKDLPLLLKLLDPKKDETILDVGAGTGYIASKVAALCDNVYALEPNYNRVEFIKRKYPEVKAFSGRSDSIPFPEAYFDKIYVVSAFHHFPDQNIALEEMARVEKQNGWLLIHEANPSKAGLGTSMEARLLKEGIKFVTPRELEQMAAKHFTTQSITDAHKGYLYKSTKE